MDIYNLTKGQIIILWIGLLLSFIMATNASEMGVDFLGVFLGGLSITALAIYTVGWKNYKKNK